MQISILTRLRTVILIDSTDFCKNAGKQGNVNALFQVSEFGRYDMNFTPTVENCPVLECQLSYHQEGRISLQFIVMELSRKYLNFLDP